MSDSGGTGNDQLDGRLGDETLARRAAARDPAAWSAIFERNWRPVFLFVRSRVGEAAVAEDLASQVFEIAYGRADRFDYRGLPIDAWLVGIARNVLRDHFKKGMRRGVHDELDEALLSIDVPDESGRTELRIDLAMAMRALTEDQQTVVVLRFLQDRSVSETAMLMDRSEDAVKNLQRRALGALQRALSGTAYAEERAG